MPYGKASRLGWLGIARERIAGSPVLPSATIPVNLDAWEPEDTPKFLADEGIRAVMASPAGMVMTTRQAGFSFGGPFLLDSGGYWLDNLFGDVSTTSTGTLSTGQAFASATLAGATTFTLASSIGSVSAGSIVCIADGAASEVVTATQYSTGLTVNCAGTTLRFGHGTTATAALQTAPGGYQHTFAVLNGGTGQPPTSTITDVTGLTPVTGGRCYPMAALAGLELSGAPGALITAKYTGASWISSPASAAPTPATSFTSALPGWLATISVGGAPVSTIGPWTVAFARPLVAYWSAQGLPVPVYFARGDLMVSGTFTYVDPFDESPLANMLTAGLQPVTIAASNGLSGTSALSLTVTSSAAQFTKSKPVRTPTVLQYATAWAATNNTTDTGGTGGQGPATVVLGNAVTAY